MHARTRRTLPLLALSTLLVACGLAWAQGGRGGPRGGAAAEELSRAPLGRDEGEQQVLDVLAEMGADRDLRYLSVSEADGRLMRQLAEVAGATTIVELGTSTGYSGLWFSLALRATDGHLYTHELDPGRAETARENFERAGVADRITIIVGDAHETVERHQGPIDVVFLDADKEGYIDYLTKLLPKLRPGGLVLAHNMSSPRPDPRYIEAITTDPTLETTFQLMDGAGVGVTLKKR
jgi:predicted O-methyltransferase YrrM